MARDDEAIRELRRKFVCVRMVNMKGVDVSLFQFDWNVMITAVFMNADGTIYARYGSLDPKALSTTGFRRTMERVLEAHAKAERDAFKGKRGAPLTWTTPDEMPAIADRVRPWTAPKQCVHCHHVWVGLINSTWKEGKTMPASFVWHYPRPETLGLTLDRDDGARVTAVTGVAEKAGARVGDMLERADGQPIFSISDLEWVLHNAPDKGELKLDVRRGAEAASLTLALGEEWRRVARRQVFGVVGFGMKMEPLSAEARSAAGIEAGRLAISVVNVMRQGLAKDAGFKNGDVIVSVDGRSNEMADDQLVAFARMNHTVGSKLKVEVLRGGQKVELTLELK